MAKPLNVLMITHHRRYRLRGRSLVMAEHLVKRGHKVTLVVTANTRHFGITQSSNRRIKDRRNTRYVMGKTTLRLGYMEYAEQRSLLTQR